MRATDVQEIHRLPKNIYLEYIKLFPVTQSPEIKTYTTLILTLLAIIGFSIFAINPTLSTIVELQKTREDSRFANATLEEKIATLESLRTQYNSLGDDLTVISSAIPTSPEVPTLLAKIQTLARQNTVTITQMEASEVELTKKGNANVTAPSSFVFTFSIAGSYNQILAFLDNLHTFDRVVTVDSIDISRENPTSGQLQATIRARAYFHPEVKTKGVMLPE